MAVREFDVEAKDDLVSEHFCTDTAQPARQTQGGSVARCAAVARCDDESGAPRPSQTRRRESIERNGRF
jgi:hypothetical protein